MIQYVCPHCHRLVSNVTYGNETMICPECGKGIPYGGEE